MDKFIGKRLDGKYEIHDLLGVGGMAYVYRAYDRVEDRWVAIKILKEEFSDNSDFLRRFRNEAKAITLLSHPNIVEVFDVSFGDRLQYIVMEYIDGISLKEYIEQEGTIRWNEAVHFTSQILLALEHDHEKGIIHRDIKPQNIMLLQDGTIKVADFGIARFSQSETQTMTDKAIGSVHYIAPEQARGDYITDKADIYSLGVVLYEMLTGRLPFVAENAVSVALMQLQANPAMPRDVNPSIPRGLEQITMKAMEKNPVNRFQFAGEMLDDLEAFRRNPNTIFHYDLQAAAGYSTAARGMEAYDNTRFTPTYDDSYEYEEEFVRSRRGARGAMAVKGVIAAAIIVLLAVGAVWLLNNWETLLEKEEGDQLEMPKMVGMLYEEVIGNEEWSEAFKFTTTQGNDPDKRPGEVLKQTPNEGIMVKKGREVELMVNGEVAKVELQDLKNYSQADAIALLKELNLKYKSEDVADDEVEVGRIVSTDPPAGTTVDSGSIVTLYVSKGPAKKKVKVPEGLKGQLVYNATAAIEDAGLKVGSVTYDDNSKEGKDIVISVSPNPGSEVSEGATVDLIVSSGRGADKTLSKTITLPASVNQNVDLKVYRNGVVVDQQTVNPSMAGSYTLAFTGTKGQDTVVVTLDDQNYMELIFDFDSGSEPTVTASHEYQPPSTGNDPGTGDSGPGEEDNGAGGGEQP